MKTVLGGNFEQRSEFTNPSAHEQKQHTNTFPTQATCLSQTKESTPPPTQRSTHKKNKNHQLALHVCIHINSIRLISTHVAIFMLRRPPACCPSVHLSVVSIELRITIISLIFLPPVESHASQTKASHHIDTWYQKKEKKKPNSKPRSLGTKIVFQTHAHQADSKQNKALRRYLCSAWPAWLARPGQLLQLAWKTAKRKRERKKRKEKQNSPPPPPLSSAFGLFARRRCLARFVG